MKKLVFLAVSAAFAASAFTAVPAMAQSANDWNRMQEASDPGYNGRSLGWHGYTLYSSSGYGSSPYFYFDENSVRRNTWRRNGKWYKTCGNDPAVPINQPCYVNRVEYPVGYGPSVPQQYAAVAPSPGSQTAEMVGGCLVTVTTAADGKKTATSICN